MRRDLFDADESLAAVKPDGSLTQTAKDVLRACDPPAPRRRSPGPWYGIFPRSSPWCAN